MKVKKIHYGSIDGLRTIACFGIVMMHVAANNNYDITGFFYNTVISSFTNFVFLFMTISAFGMCCGYYERMLGKQSDGTPQLSLTEFYKKRFQKVLPFFAILSLIDLVMSPSKATLYETFANITLLFGLLPNGGDISVIGVGWFLGLVFVFYLLFPFFCVLIENKRRAWISLLISLFYSIISDTYFDIGRTNILYCSSFFLVGGIIYLYKDDIATLIKNKKCVMYVLPIILIFSLIFYYSNINTTLGCLLVSTFLLLTAITNDSAENLIGDGCLSWLLNNKLTTYISKISMEIYLSHMVVFRVIEKVRLNTILGNGWLQYIVTVGLVMINTVLFSIIVKVIINFIKRRNWNKRVS